MSRHHEGVSCDSCLQNSFRGKRYKCLACYDFDLCATCYDAGVTKHQHVPEHPMQCILPRGEIDMYYGGETTMNPELPQSFTCPCCSQMGFTTITLADHVAKTHSEVNVEVICPICVTVPGGDPNRMTDDIVRHLSVDHRSASHDLVPLLDEGMTIRVHDTRRVPHPVYRGRTRPRRPHMQFNPGQVTTRTSTLVREPVDPIAELLSHLSGVHRTASSTNNGAFQQFQMQWQLDRHVHATRQHLERLTHHHPARTSNSERKTEEDTAGLTVNPQQSAPSTTSGGSSKFLLPCVLNELSICHDADDINLNRGLFVQELVMSSLSRPKQQLLKKKMSCLQDLEEFCVKEGAKQPSVVEHCEDQ